MRQSIYNNVSVTYKNLGTGNHCININQICNGKDFNFLIDNKHYILTCQQVMNYIANHPKKYKHIESIDNETGKIKSYNISFYLISDDYIISNAA